MKKLVTFTLPCGKKIKIVRVKFFQTHPVVRRHGSADFLMAMYNDNDQCFVFLQKMMHYE